MAVNRFGEFKPLTIFAEETVNVLLIKGTLMQI